MKDEIYEQNVFRAKVYAAIRKLALHSSQTRNKFLAAGVISLILAQFAPHGSVKQGALAQREVIQFLSTLRVFFQHGHDLVEAKAGEQEATLRGLALSQTDTSDFVERVVAANVLSYTQYSLSLGQGSPVDTSVSTVKGGCCSELVH